MRHPRLTLAACLAVVLAAPAYVRVREPPSLAALAAGTGPAPEVLFVFVPADCRLSSGAIDALNRLAARPGAAVRGVMLDAPAAPGEAEELARAFGIRFPLTFERDGEWRVAAGAAGLDPPAVLVRRGTGYVPVGDPHAPARLHELVAAALGGKE